MINFSEMRSRHYKITKHYFHNDVEECSTCLSGEWPCDAIKILDDFEFFIKKMKFNADVINSWIEDYTDSPNIENVNDSVDVEEDETVTSELT